MVRDRSTEDVRRAARQSALRRLEEIHREEAAIRASFPELFATGVGPGGRGAPSKRATMSTAMRKAVSERMKKYWAARRRTKNG